MSKDSKLFDEPKAANYHGLNRDDDTISQEEGRRCFIFWAFMKTFGNQAMYFDHWAMHSDPGVVPLHCFSNSRKKDPKIRIYHFARQTCQIKIQDLFHGIFEWKLIGKCLDASSATKGQTSTENQMKSTSTVDSQLVEGTMGSGTKELYRSLTDATEDSEFAVRPGIATRGVFRFSAT